MGGAGDKEPPSLRRGLSAFAGTLAHAGAAARKLPALATIAAVFLIGLPLASYYLRPSAAPETSHDTNGVILVSPRAGAHANQPITFVWRALAGAERYEITVFSDDGERLVHETTRDTTFRASGEFVVGRDYSWTVTAHLPREEERGANEVKFRIEERR